ncbi:MAG: hypothetical protein HYY78_08915 [Betaproteobacteria bacterium]|nr:hypothetical protein [Betaproteobacteria bacterium]
MTRILRILSLAILAGWWAAVLPQAWAGLVLGPAARTQFEGFRDGPTADTFIDFNSFAAGTALSTQVSGVTFQSNINTAGNPFGPINVVVSSAGQCTIRCIVGTPFTSGSDDGRVGYQILFTTPQRRAGLLRNWLAQYSLTRFYNASGALLAEHINTVNAEFVGYIADGTDPSTDWVARIQMDGLMNDGITRQVGYSDDLFFGSAQAGSTFTPALEPGFNLIGNSLDITLDLPALFGNQDAPTALTPDIVSIWKWSAAAGRWAFYSPTLTVAGNAAYAASQNYEVLATINAGEGYWVNSIPQRTLPAQTGTEFAWNGTSFGALPSGFNLTTHSRRASSISR